MSNWIGWKRRSSSSMGLVDRLFPYCDALANIRRLIGIVVCCYGLAVALAFYASGLGFSIGRGWHLLAPLPILAGLAWFYRRIRPDPWISHGSESMLNIALILLMATLGTFAAAALGVRFSLRDEWLARADSALGFDWPAYLAFVNSHPILGRICHMAYLAMDPEFLAIVGALIAARQLARLQIFTIAVALSLFLTTAIFTVMPATSYYELLHVPATDYANLNPTVPHGSFIRLLGALRSIPGYTVQLDDLDGLVAFPSFHTEAAILFIWGFWALPWLRLWMLALNLTIIAATPIDGAHYLVDDVAGALIAAVALILAKRIAGALKARQTLLGAS